MAPSLRGLFRQPKETMAGKLASILSTLVSFSAQPGTVDEVPPHVKAGHVP